MHCLIATKRERGTKWYKPVLVLPSFPFKRKSKAWLVWENIYQFLLSLMTMHWRFKIVLHRYPMGTHHFGV